MIAVTGGKGGVGTTTVALNLAVALATSGHRTVLVDVAANADAAQLAGIDMTEGPCLADVVEGSISARDALRDGPCGLALVASRWAGDVDLRADRTLDRLLGELSTLTETTDILVVDTGSGLSTTTRRFWQRANLLLAVTTPGDTAIMDTYAMLKAGIHDAATNDADARVLVNQCDTAAVADDVHRRMANACSRFLRLELGRAPRLPLKAFHSYASMSIPRAWEETDSPFARGVHQLGRFAADVLAQRRWQLDARCLKLDARYFEHLASNVEDPNSGVAQFSEC
jgi:flagellar biosynthesis protein FlhG